MAKQKKQTNKTWLIGALLLVAVAIAVVFAQKDKQPILPEVLRGEVVIEMGEDDYAPNEITIARGTTVKFVNVDEAARWPASDLHPSHGIYPDFDPKKPILPGESWSFTFNEVGEWSMHDHLAPYITGNISVVVEY